MLKAELTLEQEDIIKDICNIQIQSLLRVSMKKKVSNFLLKVGIEMSSMDIDSSISEMLKSFDKLKSHPSKLMTLDESCISLFKHHLFNNDDKYSKGKHLPHKKNLWVKIGIKENFNILMN